MAVCALFHSIVTHILYTIPLFSCYPLFGLLRVIILLLTWRVLLFTYLNTLPLPRHVSDSLR